ncbi:molybdopterin dinucleotide binding domain-containing protein [Streptomyces sp. NRRL F-4474]|uniref:molybdopterin dinucleotide binding domain-containing protein n=1 Tax=Streptomyces sp. NRRL F-4474 TaxID=1463851 RepID=UPI003B631BBB
MWEADAAAAGLGGGGLAEVSTRRGSVRARVRDQRYPGGRGLPAVPLRLRGRPGRGGHHRAADELTPTAWDPASRQPLFKNGAARVTPVSRCPARPRRAQPECLGMDRGRCHT